MFVLETVYTEGIAQLSYLVGDTSSGRAAVIDPRTDAEIYLELARKHGLSITHVFETHIHADFVSGSRSLIELAGTAELCLSAEDASYAFDGRGVTDGDRFDFGAFNLTARHTPGHTPEHLAFELRLADHGDTLVGVFTGDSLFVGSAGRPDLLGDDQAHELARKLHTTLYDYFLKLDDHVLVYPGHGAGSACGADIGDRKLSTIGFERRTNPFLRCPDFETFHERVVEDAPPAPVHYSRLKQVNAAGPAVMCSMPTPRALPPEEFRKASREPATVVLDTRSMLAFGGGHVPGAIHIGARPELSNWAPQILDPDTSLLLVVDDECDLDDVLRLLVRTGLTCFAGYLAGGMTAWETSGLPLATLKQVPVNELEDATGSGRILLDVRSESEFGSGHIPGAEHHALADMRQRIDGLDKSRPYATYCGSGYRASIASSLMQARGFEDVVNVPGSMKAWKAKDRPVEQSA